MYANSDGSRTAVIASNPVRVKDPSSGAWQDIDLTLRDDPDGTLRPRVAETVPRFARRGGGDEVTVPSPGGAISLGHPGATAVDVSARENRAAYPGALGGRDLVLAATTSGVEESVVVPRPELGGSYNDRLTLPRNATARNAAGNVEIVSAAGKVIARFGGGEAFDAAGATTRVTTRLVRQQGTVATVAVAISPAGWLSAPERSMPVTIDPVLNVYANTSQVSNGNTYLTEGYTTPILNPATLYVGKTAYGRTRTLIRFPLGLDAQFQPASNVWVTNATMSVYNVDSYHPLTQRTINAYGVGGFWSTDLTTWTNTTPQGGPPLDAYGVAAQRTFAYGNGGCCSGAWVTFDIRALAQRWMNTTELYYGVELRAADEYDVAAMRKFHGGINGGNAAPAISIDYELIPNVPDQLAPVAGAAFRTPPTLSARYTHPQATSGDVNFVIKNSQGAVVASGWGGPPPSGNGGTYSSFTSGSTVSWTPPSSPDGNYTFGAAGMSSTGIWGYASAYVPFVVDSIAPDAVPAIDSASHNRGFPSNNRTVTFRWAPPTSTGGSALAGYSWTFNTSSESAADTTVDTSLTTMNSASLSDGQWWFHVRAVDAAGNAGADKSFGPFAIDGSAITLPDLPSTQLLDETCDSDASYWDPIHCGGPPDAIAPTVDLDEVRNLYGYRGPYYSPVASGSGVPVLPETVSTSSSGMWGAQGLVRNETAAPVGVVTVTALLRGAGDAILGSANAAVAVAPLRPHEPGPFTLTSSIAAADVVRVEWSTAWLPATATERTLRIQQSYSAPYGDRPQIGHYLYDETGPAPLPAVVGGNVANDGTATVTNPIVVGVWLDAEGRVIWSTSTPLKSAPTVALSGLAPGKNADFTLVVDDPGVAPLLGSSDRLVVWAVGS